MRLSIRFAIAFVLCPTLGACAMGATSLTPPLNKDAGADSAVKDGGTKDSAASDANVTPEADIPDKIVTTCKLDDSFGSPACDSCMEASCCVETNTCMGSSQCSSFLGCLSTCVDGDGGIDQTCANTCASQNPSGANQYDSMVSCGDSFCRNQCFQ